MCQVAKTPDKILAQLLSRLNAMLEIPKDPKDAEALKEWNYHDGYCDALRWVLGLEE